MTQFQGLNCILLVDDDTPTNFLHKMVIKKSGIEAEVQALTSAIDALDYLTKKGKYAGHEVTLPEMILLDINMPAMDGWEFLEAYQQMEIETRARIIIIMLTTSLNPADRERAANHKEIVTFLNKPLQPGVLEEVVSANFKKLS